MELSVVICTHNPRKHFMNRVLNALKVQSLNYTYWELLIVDNCSELPISQNYDLSWHPLSRHIIEEKLGSAPARIRGIEEARFEYVLFVDDDNCLDMYYLEIALKKIKLNPDLGVLGSGKILPEFEVEPTVEVMQYTNMLALRNENRCYFSNDVVWSKAIPYTAGMIIRRHLALDYVNSSEERTFSTILGRVGKELLSGEDVDMALHACSKQFLVGIVPELEIIHLIPKERLTEDYMIKIAAGHAYSHYLLGRMWGYLADYPENKVLRHLRGLRKRLKVKGLAEQVFLAERNAEKRAKLAWKKASSVEKNILQI